MVELIDAKAVSNNLKSARVRKGLVQQDVADALGVSRQHFSRMERNPSNMKLKTYLMLAELYGVPLAYFFGV